MNGLRSEQSQEVATEDSEQASEQLAQRSEERTGSILKLWQRLEVQVRESRPQKCKASGLQWIAVDYNGLQCTVIHGLGRTSWEHGQSHVRHQSTGIIMWGSFELATLLLPGHINVAPAQF